MNKNKKILTGILSFLPLFMGVIAIIFMFTSFIPTVIRLENQDGGQASPFAVFSELMPLFIVAIIAGIISLAALIYFIIHVMNNRQLKSEERIIWVLVFIFAGSIGYPIYWGIRIWQEPKPETNFIKM